MSSVVFCCTVSPVLAQPSYTTYTLNGLWADVISPSVPVRLGDTFWISVALRRHGDPHLQGFQVLLDGRPLGRRDGIALSDGIGDGIPDNREWFEAPSLYATTGDVVLRITVTETTGRGGVIEMPLRLLPPADADADTLPDLWELRLGLSIESATGDDGPDGDPDGDGSRNHDEFLRNTHPRGFYTRYFAEGVGGDFFETTIQPSNLPGGGFGRMHIRMLDADGWAASITPSYFDPSKSQYAPASYESRRLLDSYATIIESTMPLVAERWTKWPTFRPGGSPLGYGSHGSEGTASLSTRWLFAEAVTGAFRTYVTLVNPSAQTARLTVAYLGVDGVPTLLREHTIAPDSRGTIDVNADAAGLASMDLAIEIYSSVPIAAERSVYRDVGSAIWGAGTSSVGAQAPAVQWFFAEGLANPLFDTYLLLLNPGATTAEVDIEVLRADGTPITLTRTIFPRSRATVHMNSAHPALASSSSSTSFGLAVRSTNGASIVAERTMWWNDPVRGTRWVEGHTSMGTPELSTRWYATPSWLWGWYGDAAVYLLLANPNATPATVRVTLPPAYEALPKGEVVMTVPAFGRATLDVSGTFVWELGVRPDGRHTALLVESLGDTPVPIVAERSIYANTRDAVWELGSNTMLTRLPPWSPPSLPATHP